MRRAKSLTKQHMPRKPSVRKKSELTAQQVAFCNAYVRSYNGTKAAIAAKYSGKTAATRAGILLRSPRVREYIRELQEKQLKNAFVSPQRVEMELAKLAFSNVMDYIDVKEIHPPESPEDPEDPEQSNPKLQYVEVRDLRLLDTAAIQEIHQTKYGIRIKLHGKDAALEKLMRMKGMFDIDNQQKRPVIVIGDDDEETAE